MCKLNPKKTCQESDIPVKIIKENLDIVSNFVYNNFNKTKSPFLKRKSESTLRIIILPNLSKVYERCMHFQIFENLNEILPKCQFAFHQGYSAQHCRLVIIEKWRQRLDKGRVSGALLTVLSKAFDCILHDL